MNATYDVVETQQDAVEAVWRFRPRLPQGPVSPFADRKPDIVVDPTHIALSGSIHPEDLDTTERFWISLDSGGLKVVFDIMHDSLHEAEKPAKAEICEIAIAGPGAGVYVLDESLEQRFDRLKNEWIQETAIMSFVEDMMDCASFRAIVALGNPVVPLILKEFEQRRDHWDLFLVEITGENPVPENVRGNLKKTAALWIAWGRKRYEW